MHSRRATSCDGIGPRRAFMFRAGRMAEAKDEFERAAALSRNVSRKNFC
jgi:predicted RNA polymerase sigma factor